MRGWRWDSGQEECAHSAVPSTTSLWHLSRAQRPRPASLCPLTPPLLSSLRTGTVSGLRPATVLVHSKDLNVCYINKWAHKWIISQLSRAEVRWKPLNWDWAPRTINTKLASVSWGQSPCIIHVYFAPDARLNSCWVELRWIIKWKQGFIMMAWNCMRHSRDLYRKSQVVLKVIPNV